MPSVRLSFPRRDKIFCCTLITLMVPSAVTALYHDERGAPSQHLLGDIPALRVRFAVSIFLVRQFFRSIPQGVIDAARVDGASETRVLSRIIVPLSKPVIITATLIALVFGWDNFLWPLIVTNSQSLYVLTIGLANLQPNMNAQWTLVQLGVLFVLFQRNIIRSITIAQIR